MKIDEAIKDLGQIRDVKAELETRVTDDSGFLAVVVPASYEGFVDRDWQLDQLFDHFRQQMLQRSLLIWGTGLEGRWRVDVRLRESSVQGYREIS